jgi:ABC-type antimicrobial peptide transport system ATPase subunit
VTSSGQQVKDTPGQIIEADPGHNYQAAVVQSVSDANAAGPQLRSLATVCF